MFAMTTIALVDSTCADARCVVCDGLGACITMPMVRLHRLQCGAPHRGVCVHSERMHSVPEGAVCDTHRRQRGVRRLCVSMSSMSWWWCEMDVRSARTCDCTRVPGALHDVLAHIVHRGVPRSAVVIECGVSPGGEPVPSHGVRPVDIARCPWQHSPPSGSASRGR